MQRQCLRCLETKDVADFSKDRQRKDGIRVYCKPCERLRTSAWYARNSDHVKAKTKRWKEENPERKKELDRLWYLENKEEVKIGVRAWVQANPDRRKAIASKWQRENPASAAASRQNRRAKLAQAEGNHTADDIVQLYVEQEGRCAYCEKIVGDDYHVDHIYPLSRGGANSPDNLAIACPTCNLSKGAKTLDEWRGVPSLK